MSVKRLSKTDEFVALDEIRNSVLVIEYTEVVGVDTLDGGATEKPGLKHYVTAANETINSNMNGSYTIVGKDILLRRPEKPGS